MNEAGNVLLERAVYDGLAAVRAYAKPDGRYPKSAPIRRIARRLMANALGAGNQPLLHALAPADSGGRFSVLALGTRASTPEQAAAATAAAVTISQCDEGLRTSRGHPGLHAFAAAFAMVEQADGNIDGLLEATGAGWEIGARLGLTLGAPRDGVHPHGGWGAAAAAASASVAMGLDDGQVLSAVASALTVALGGPNSSTYAGRDSHFLLPALGTANGVTTARLTAVGMQPPVAGLAHFAQITYGDILGSSSTSDCGDAALVDHAYFKPIGVCAHALPSWESAVQLGNEIEPGDIAAISVRTYAAAAQLCDRQPANRLGRQFSIPWIVASGLAGTDPEADGGAEVRALAAITAVEHDATLDARYPAARPSYLTIRLHDGSRLERFAEFHSGDSERPFSEADYAAIDDRILSRADDVHRAIRSYNFLGRDGATPLREFAQAATGTTHT